MIKELEHLGVIFKENDSNTLIDFQNNSYILIQKDIVIFQSEDSDFPFSMSTSLFAKTVLNSYYDQVKERLEMKFYLNDGKKNSELKNLCFNLMNVANSFDMGTENSLLCEISMVCATLQQYVIDESLRIKQIREKEQNTYR